MIAKLIRDAESDLCSHNPEIRRYTTMYSTVRSPSGGDKCIDSRCRGAQVLQNLLQQWRRSYMMYNWGAGADDEKILLHGFGNLITGESVTV